LKGSRKIRFKECKLSERRLCKDNQDENFEIRFYHYSQTGNHEYFGKAAVAVSSVLDPREIRIVDRSGSGRGTVMFYNVKRTIKSSFTDYIASGLQLMLITAIDFTASNGSPNSTSSLHYTQPHKKSTY
jgi:hypothetical protein